MRKIFPDCCALLGSGNPERVFSWYGALRYVAAFTSFELTLPPELIQADAVGRTGADTVLHYAGATGGLRYWKDGRDVPDVFLGEYDYPKTAAHPEFTLALRVNFKSGAGETSGFRFVGSEGIMTIGNGVTNVALPHLSGSSTPGIMIQLVSLGDTVSIDERYSRKYRLKTFYSGWVASEAVTAGRVDLIPSRFSRIPWLFRSGAVHIDVAVIQITPPDERGHASLGLGVDVARYAMEQASLVVAEINTGIPRTLGDTFEEFVIIEAGRDPAELRFATGPGSTGRAGAPSSVGTARTFSVGPPWFLPGYSDRGY